MTDERDAEPDALRQEVINRAETYYRGIESTADEYETILASFTELRGGYVNEFDDDVESSGQTWGTRALGVSAATLPSQSRANPVRLSVAIEPATGSSATTSRRPSWCRTVASTS